MRRDDMTQIVQALTEPDVEKIVSLATSGFGNTNTKKTYRSCLKDFMGWRGSRPFVPETIEDYRQYLIERGLTASTVNTRITAVRKLAEQALEHKLLDRRIAEDVIAVTGIRNSGVRSGNWLTREEANRLLTMPDTTKLRGLRDRALLSILLGAGLRRREAKELTVDKLALRDERWVILDINGKGNKVRTVPVPDWCYRNVRQWLRAADIETGNIFVPVMQEKLTGTSISEQTVYNIVSRYGNMIGKLIGPHDLRRTFAKLAYTGGARLDQIQFSLGHASIRTTEQYLGMEQDIVDAPCDYVGLRG